MKSRMRWPSKIRIGTGPCLLILGFLLLLPPFSPASSGQAKRLQKSYAPFPQPDAGYVTDNARLLGREEERIEQWLWQVEKKKGLEIIVVTVSSIEDYPGTPNASVEQFAKALFDTYGIGNANDGVLLLVALTERKARIELGAAYGRRRDSDARRIMDEVIVPRFRKAAYAEGISEGVRAIALEFAEVRIGLNWPLIVTLSIIPVAGLVGFSLLKNGKRGWGWAFLGVAIILLLLAVWMVVSLLRRSPGSSRGWSPGGLGGFGGGSSGGGGATGNW